jgi:hypothetical protein
LIETQLSLGLRPAAIAASLLRTFTVAIQSTSNIIEALEGWCESTDRGCGLCLLCGERIASEADLTRNEILRTEDERSITNVKTLTQAVGHHDASMWRRERGDEPSVESPGAEPSDGSRGISTQTVRDDPFVV